MFSTSFFIIRAENEIDKRILTHNKYTIWRLTKLTQNDEEYLPARTINERIMARKYASSYADRHPGDVK